MFLSERSLHYNFEFTDGRVKNFGRNHPRKITAENHCYGGAI